MFEYKVDMVDEHIRTNNDTYKERFENFKNDNQRIKESKDNIELIIMDNSSK